MKNIPEIKLGIVVGSTDWLPSEVAIEKRRRLVNEYKSVYGENSIYECSICITDNEVSLKRAAKDFAKAECNALCVYYANYGPESSGTLFAQNFNGPVMFLGAAEEGDEPFARNRLDSLSGFINACYALGLRNTNAYIPEHPIGTFKQCVEMIHEFIYIARTIVAVSELKIISFSPRPSSYLAAYAPNHLLYDMDIEISEYSELELLNSYEKHEGDKRIEKIVAEMVEELGEEGKKHPEILPKLAQYEITVNDWVRNHKGDRKYVALTSTCWPAFPVNFGFTPCYVNSRLTGMGIPVACEVDVFGAVSEYIGQCISDDIVTILNINNDVPQSVYDAKIKNQEFNGKQYEIADLFIGYHCGVTCSSKLTSCSMQPHFVNNQLLGPEQSQGTIHGRIEASPCTIFRIQGFRDGKLMAYVAQGQILPVDMETYGGYGIIAVPEMGRFIRNVVLEKHYPNHAAVLFGHYGKELIGVLKQMGITDIQYNHPKNQPYKGENVYAALDEWY